MGRDRISFLMVYHRNRDNKERDLCPDLPCLCSR